MVPKSPRVVANGQSLCNYELGNSFVKTAGPRDGDARRCQLQKVGEVWRRQSCFEGFAGFHVRRKFAIVTSFCVTLQKGVLPRFLELEALKALRVDCVPWSPEPMPV